MKINLLNVQAGNNPDAGIIRLENFRFKIIPLVYRCVALLLASILVFFFSSLDDFVINPYLLLGLATVELLLASSLPFLTPPAGRTRTPGLIISLTSVILCTLPVIFSGALRSPFLPYSLAPMLTVALFANKRLIFITSVSMVFILIIFHVLNPFTPFQITRLSISQMATYCIASAFISILPYIININLKEHLEGENILRERRRLSREIHDGAAQTMHALCWQVQGLRQNLTLTPAEDCEVQKLEKLAEKARRDILESLEMLRNNNVEKDLVAVLRDCLENFKKDVDIDCALKVESGDITLDRQASSELSRICQEALTNIKKHAGAHKVRINLEKVHNHLELSIIDDGQGIEDPTLSRERQPDINYGHYGLAVMRERARMINGTLQVLSAPSRGTEVKIEIPYRPHRGRT